MRAMILLSGELACPERIADLLADCDQALCVDGGARHFRRLDLLPDRLIGDLDSIDPADLSWLKRHNVPISRFPAQKDATDSELALQAVWDLLCEPLSDHEIIIAGALGSRPDHGLANELMVAAWAEKGLRLRITDGVSDLYTLVGGQTLVIPFAAATERPAISTIAISDKVSELSYQGLRYPLQEACLSRGSTRGVSNERAKEKTAGENPPVRISLGQGTALVVVTPAV